MGTPLASLTSWGTLRAGFVTSSINIPINPQRQVCWDISPGTFSAACHCPCTLHLPGHTGCTPGWHAWAAHVGGTPEQRLTLPTPLVPAELSLVQWVHFLDLSVCPLLWPSQRPSTSSLNMAHLDLSQQLPNLFLCPQPQPSNPFLISALKSQCKLPLPCLNLDLKVQCGAGPCL